MTRSASHAPLMKKNLPIAPVRGPYALVRAGPYKTGHPCEMRAKIAKEDKERTAVIIKYLLTKVGQAERENNRLSVMTHGPRCAHDLEENIFPFGPPAWSIGTCYTFIVLSYSVDDIRVLSSSKMYVKYVKLVLR